MPYSGPNDRELPEYVKKLSQTRRKRWVNIFNDTFEQCEADDGTDCEGQAFKAANGVVLNKLIVISNRAGPARRETHDGIEYLIAPMVAARVGVMNDLLYTFEELSTTVTQWDGVPVPLDHPRDDTGAHISANSADILARCLGWVRNPMFHNSKLRAELWLDIDKANEIGGDAVVAIEKIETGQMVNVSTGLFGDIEPAVGIFNGRTYSGIIRNLIPDHIAILLNEGGACSINDGCGVPRVNQEETSMPAKTIVHNIELSLTEKEALVYDAWWAERVMSGSLWKIMQDQIIVSQPGKILIIPYEIDTENTVTFGEPVEADIVPMATNANQNLIQQLKNLPERIAQAIRGKEANVNKKDKLKQKLLQTKAGFSEEQLDGFDEQTLELVVNLAEAAQPDKPDPEQPEGDKPKPNQAEAKPEPTEANEPPAWFTQWSGDFEERFKVVEGAMQANARQERARLMEQVIKAGLFANEDEVKDVPDTALQKLVGIPVVNYAGRGLPVTANGGAGDYEEAPMPRKQEDD